MIKDKLNNQVKALSFLSFLLQPLFTMFFYILHKALLSISLLSVIFILES
jgi:hypothetical protein